MLEFNVEATLWYTCMIDGEDELKILNKAKQIKDKKSSLYYSESDDKYISEAIRELYFEDYNTDIELYKSYTESDFATESINFESDEALTIEERIAMCEERREK